MSITTTSELEAYLHSTFIPFESVTYISNGSANYVWRIETPSSSTLPPSTIAKHAEPFVRIAPALALAQSRLDFEARALQTVPSHLPPDDLIRLPTLYHHDAARYLLLMEDAGPRSLKEAYPDPHVDARAWGRRLGVWAARLHASTREVQLGRNEAASIYRFIYVRLADTLEEWGVKGGRELAEKVNDVYGARLGTDDECLCYGDFWPGNLMLGDAGADGKRMLTAVDWEMVRRGCGATDVGQFAAEAFLLDRFRGGRGLMGEFLASYAEEAKPGREFLEVMAVHFGTHIAFWPTRVKWAGKEETKEVMDLGVEVLKKVIEKNWAWFEKSVLKSFLIKTS